MAQKFLTSIDLNQNELLNVTLQSLATDPTGYAGRLYYNSTNNVVRVYNGTAWVNTISSISATGANSNAITVTNSANGTVTISLSVATAENAGLLTGAFFTDLTNATTSATLNTLVKRNGDGNISVATPTADAHAATKAYVDASRSGLDVKQSVRAATTAALTIASQLENGDIIDGVTLATGDRVLVKNQSTASENGIYVVQSTGAAVRATDFDGTGEVSGGAFTFVEEGTANADSGFVVTSNGAITVGTDAIVWAQFSGAGAFAAGDGLTKSGTTINAVGTAGRITVNPDSIDIASTYAGQSTITEVGTISSGTWGSGATDIAIASGGTGASTAEDARTNLGLAIGTDVQAYDVQLAAIATVTSAADKLPYFTGSTTADVTTLTTFGRSLIDDADAATSRTTLGVVIGTDVQAYNSTLAAVAGGTYTGDDSITTLGTITTGVWNSSTDIAVADGGTGASTAADARANLGTANAGGATTSTPVLARIAKQGCAASSSGTSTTTVTHNFNTTAVIVQIFEFTSGATVIGDVVRTNANVVTVTLLGTILLNDYTIVVTG